MDFFAQDTRIELPLGSTDFFRDGEERPNINFEPNAANRFILDVKAPTLTIHLPKMDASASPRPVALICPGGGYAGVSLDMEGNYLASFLNRFGIAAAVLKYRIPTESFATDTWPLPFIDALDAIALLQKNADEWALDFSRFAIVGFSAGGHLAGSIALRFDELAAGRSLPRPSHVALVYPVVSVRRPDDNAPIQRTFSNLLRTNISEKALDEYSLESRVTPSSPAIFLAHAADDTVVPIWHSELLFDTARKNNVPTVLHTYQSGGHGFCGHGFGASSTEEPSAAWRSEFVKWFL